MSAIHLNEPPVPRTALWLVGGLVAFTLIAATAVRLGYVPVAASPKAERTAAQLKPTATRDLSFLDRADGGLVITDLDTGRAVKTFQPGEASGFIRGMMRGLARERRMNKVGPAAPFRLESWPNGQLSLTDRATGRSIELTAFGGTNRAAFAELLK